MKIMFAILLIHFLNCIFITIHAMNMLKEYEVKVSISAKIATFLHCLIHPISNIIFLYAIFSSRVDESKIVKSIIDKKEGQPSFFLLNVC